MDYKYTEKEIWDAIHILSDIRSGYNCFDEKNVEKYEACSMGIIALRKLVNADKTEFHGGNQNYESCVRCCD